MTDNKTLKKYARFIGDSEFIETFFPDFDDSEELEDDEVAESFTFTHSPDFVEVKMRDYQVEGLNWLIKMHENGINCILADEMGLGKTLQSIALLGYIKIVKQEKAKHLVVVPKSCLQNWANEFKKFVPSLKVKVFHVSKSEIKSEAVNVIHKKYDVILTTYEMCLFAQRVFRKVSWSYILIDEAHRLKNENSQLSMIVRLFKFQHRLLLTGTPLQNNIHELWALLNFIVPDVFYDSEKFENYVVAADQSENSIEKLRNVLQLFFLRREKLDVERSLMEKKIINIYCPLSEMQRNWYKSILKKDLTNLYQNTNIKSSLLNVVMQLKKCCNHPYLFDGAEPEPFETGEHLIYNSGKLAILDKLLQNLKQKGSRVLIFSQMSSMIDILEDYVNFREYEYCRIDGSTSSEDRTIAIDQFNAENSTKFVFLLTTRAGGLGINLYTADSVVIFDSDWNPQADLQAQDRAHRIGQTKQVHVFRLITENTIEEGIVLRAQQKLKLDDILIQKGQKKMSNSLSQKELMDILSTGIDAVDQETNLTNLSIEDILRKGEEKTKEMDEKLERYKIADSKDVKIDLYQWEGENYSKRKLEEFIENNTEEIRPTRNSIFTVKRFKPLSFPEYQFYPKEFYDLQDKEEQLINNNGVLSEEDQKYKEELLSKGFSWTKKDFKMFLSAVESSGNNLEKIKEALPHKTDVEEYYKVFWERFDELPESEKIRNMLEKSEMKNKKRNTLKKIFEIHSGEIEDALMSKNKFYLDDLLLLNIYFKHIDHPQCFDKIKQEIHSSEDFMFDYFLLSRSPHDLSKHIEVLTAQILKAFDK